MSREVHMSIMWVKEHRRFETSPATVALNAERGDVLLLYAGGKKVDVDLGAKHPFIAFPPGAIEGNRLRIERGTEVRLMARERRQGQDPYWLYEKLNPKGEQPSPPANPGEVATDHGDIIFDP